MLQQRGALRPEPTINLAIHGRGEKAKKLHGAKKIRHAASDMKKSRPLVLRRETNSRGEIEVLVKRKEMSDGR